MIQRHGCSLLKLLFIIWNQNIHQTRHTQTHTALALLPRLLYGISCCLILFQGINIPQFFFCLFEIIHQKHKFYSQAAKREASDSNSNPQEQSRARGPPDACEMRPVSVCRLSAAVRLCATAARSLWRLSASPAPNSACAAAACACNNSSGSLFCLPPGFSSAARLFSSGAARRCGGPSTGAPGGRPRHRQAEEEGETGASTDSAYQAAADMLLEGLAGQLEETQEERGIEDVDCRVSDMRTHA